MLDLTNIGSSILPQVPLLNIKVDHIRIDIMPSEIPLLPVIHIEAKLDVKFGF